MTFTRVIRFPMDQQYQPTNCEAPIPFVLWKRMDPGHRTVPLPLSLFPLEHDLRALKSSLEERQRGSHQRWGLELATTMLSLSPLLPQVKSFQSSPEEGLEPEAARTESLFPLQPDLQSLKSSLEERQRGIHERWGPELATTVLSLSPLLPHNESLPSSPKKGQRGTEEGLGLEAARMERSGPELTAVVLSRSPVLPQVKPLPSSPEEGPRRSEESSGPEAAKTERSGPELTTAVLSRSPVLPDVKQLQSSPEEGPQGSEEGLGPEAARTERSGPELTTVVLSRSALLPQVSRPLGPEAATMEEIGQLEVAGTQSNRNCRQPRRHVPPKKTSRFKGVAKYKRTSRWEANIWAKGKQIYLGASTTEKRAARAYDRATIHFRGPRAELNFNLTDYSNELRMLAKISDMELVTMLRTQSAGDGSLYPQYPPRLLTP